MSNRQIARDLSVAPETINRQLARLGRHCILFHTRMMRRAAPTRQIVIDGFVSFELSQFFPFHHHLAVEKETDFFLYFTDSEVRRSGRMTASQKRRRHQLEARFGRPDPRAVCSDVSQLVAVVVGRQPGVTVYSDDHRVYPQALRRVGTPLRHEVTASRAFRGVWNPLWEINLLDLVIRHSSANHKRETVAWSKRRQSSAQRLAVLLVWRNYMQRRREKRRGGPTPAMARGVVGRRLQANDILAERLFVSRIALPPRWRQYYWGEVGTRALARQRRHALRYAT
jgi:hypothetical protein